MSMIYKSHSIIKIRVYQKGEAGLQGKTSKGKKLPQEVMAELDKIPVEAYFIIIYCLPQMQNAKLDVYRGGECQNHTSRVAVMKTREVRQIPAIKSNGFRCSIGAFWQVQRSPNPRLHVYLTLLSL